MFNEEQLECFLNAYSSVTQMMLVALGGPNINVEYRNNILGLVDFMVI